MLRKAGSEGRLEVLDWTRELFNLNTENDAAPGAVQKPAGDASATDSE